MNRSRRISLLAVGLILLVSLGADDALAQRRGGSRGGGGGGGLAGPIEISGMFGHMWGGNLQVINGKIRTATGSSYGGVVGIPIHPAMLIELTYTHQDGALDWDSRGTKEKLTDMSINYWHIGTSRILMTGKVQPFVLGGLGVTYYSPGQSTFTIDSETFNTTSATKFSLSFGLGLKTFFGEAEKVGLRASFKVLPTLYNTGAGIWVGSGGASLGVSGNAIWQWEVAGGVTVRFGK